MGMPSSGMAAVISAAVGIGGMGGSAAVGCVNAVCPATGLYTPGLAARAFGSTLGLLLTPGLPRALIGFLAVVLTRLRLPSLMSPPEPAPSPSLPDAPPRGLFLRLSVPDPTRTAGGFFCSCAASCEIGAGDLDRDLLPFGVLAPVLSLEPVDFFNFFREDSFPLASDALADPGLRADFGSRCLLGRFDGVLLPLVEVAEAFCDSLALSSASFFSWSSF